MEQLIRESVQLLQNLISTPSFSRQENQTADLISAFLVDHGVKLLRSGNNVWAQNAHFQEGLPVILLNSHHDTVKPVSGWTLDPFDPVFEKGKLSGLGSNDAGGPLVSLIACFLHFYAHEKLPFNLVLAATAEEEISGKGGIASILPEIGNIDLGIIGEPTQMQMAVAEKGLMVLDCYAKGKAGHAARNEGVNAIYESIIDIEWFRNYQFPDSSSLLGPVKMTVTQVNSGTQHNVVPDICHFVVDVRTNEFYSNEAAYEIINTSTQSEIKARSFRLNSSRLPIDHPIVQKGKSLGLSYFGSPTLSDQALIPYPTLKIGPGDSARSHTANEYIMIPEIEEGIHVYIKLLEGLDIRT